MECFDCLMLLVNRRCCEVRFLFWPKRGPGGVSGVLLAASYCMVNPPGAQAK